MKTSIKLINLYKDLPGRKREKSQITNVRNIRGNITTKPPDICLYVIMRENERDFLCLNAFYLYFIFNLCSYFVAIFFHQFLRFRKELLYFLYTSEMIPLSVKFVASISSKFELIYFTMIIFYAKCTLK